MRWPRSWPKRRGRAMRRLAEKAVDGFPDTKSKNLDARVTALMKRRAKNRRARASRRRNR